MIVVSLIWIGMAGAVAHLAATKVSARPAETHDVLD